MKPWLVASCLFVVVAACSGSTPPPDDACEGPLGKPLSAGDIGALPACCQAEGGAAHCLANVPTEIQGFVEACPSGGSCIPDNFLATGASEPPAQCTAFGGPGVCLSKCIPQVAMNETALRPDVCTGADELCVPCTNPIDGTDTHACDLLTLATCVGDNPPPPPPSGVCDDPATCNYDTGCPPVIDPVATGLTACAADAHCLDAALVTDPAQASQLAKCEDATKLCVPDIFLATGGKFTPPTCTSVNGAEGRCLSTALPAVAAQASLLPQDSCAASERCTPCFSPLDGTSTGACNLSCDTGPTQPAKEFAQCCDMRARCVPTSSIPADQQDQLSAQECDQAQPGSLCVPNEILANGPFPTCTANSIILGNYTGVCLSNCLDFGIQGVALAKGSCSSGFTCAPCEQFGQPTGAPGCPQ